jgi:hypothetical protein
MQLKPQTLMVAIQCVAAEIAAMDKQLNEENSENAAELEQLLVSFDLAADDLKAAYQTAQEQFGGLPPYEELVNLPNSTR